MFRQNLTQEKKFGFEPKIEKIFSRYIYIDISIPKRRYSAALRACKIPIGILWGYRIAQERRNGDGEYTYHGLEKRRYGPSTA